MKIIFAGTPEFAVPALQALIDQSHHKINGLFEIVLVLTQPDRPINSRFTLCFQYSL